MSRNKYIRNYNNYTPKVPHSMITCSIVGRCAAAVLPKNELELDDGLVGSVPAIYIDCRYCTQIGH